MYTVLSVLNKLNEFCVFTGLSQPSGIVNIGQNESHTLHGNFNIQSMGYNGWATLHKSYICSLKPFAASEVKIHILDIWGDTMSYGSDTPLFCFIIVTHTRAVPPTCWRTQELVFDPLTLTVEDTSHPVSLIVKTEHNGPVNFRIWLQVIGKFT